MNEKELARLSDQYVASKAGRPVADPPAKAGDVVPCLVCSGKGYIHSLHHVVCRVCKGTRTVTIEAYR